MNRTSARFWTLIFKISSFACIACESQQMSGSCVAPHVRMLIAFSDFTEGRGALCTGWTDLVRFPDLPQEQLQDESLKRADL